MSRRSDDEDVNPLRRRLDDRAADALLAGREVEGEPELFALLGEMRSLASVPAPSPSAALALMLMEGCEAAPAAQAVSWRKRTWALPLQLSLGSALAVGLVLGAAAGNELPSPVQSAVADAVEAVTPLHVPRPTPHHPARVTPSPRPADDSTTRARPEPTPGVEHGKSSDHRPPTAGVNDHRTPDPSRSGDRPGGGSGDENGRDPAGPANSAPANPPGHDPRNGHG